MVSKVNNNIERRAVLVSGPTGVGKSKMALRLASVWKRHGGARIINVDSQQVYRELRVLTARPSLKDEELIPHKLYGFVSVGDPFSVGSWRKHALAEAEAAQSEGELPILVGGSGLYFKALTDGLANIPDIPDAVRERGAEKLRILGPRGLHDELAKRDPIMAARLVPDDGQRVRRAWEVLEATGISLYRWQNVGGAEPRLMGTVAKFVLTQPRDALVTRLNRRFSSMVEGGALNEIAALWRSGFDRELPGMKAQGARDLLRHLDGKISLEEAISFGQASTRQYAKRQMTWMRNQMADWTWITAKDSESFFERTFPFICQFLLTQSK